MHAPLFAMSLQSSLFHARLILASSLGTRLCGYLVDFVALPCWPSVILARRLVQPNCREGCPGRSGQERAYDWDSFDSWVRGRGEARHPRPRRCAVYAYSAAPPAVELRRGRSTIRGGIARDRGVHRTSPTSVSFLRPRPPAAGGSNQNRSHRVRQRRAFPRTRTPIHH